MTRARHLHVLGAMCAVVASAALMTGCGGDGGKRTAPATEKAVPIPPATPSPPDSPSRSSQLTQDQTARKQLLGVTKVTFDKAAATAVGEVSGSKLAELDLKGLDDNDKSESPSPSRTPSPSTTGSS
ncbi:peptidase M4, partial [Streptomyces sp. NPDC056105]